MKISIVSRNFIILIATSVVSSCSFLIPQATPKEVFILGSKQEKFCELKSNKSFISGIRERGSADYLKTQRILFRNGSKLGNYQFAEWSEPLDKRLERLISERLRCESSQISDSNQIKSAVSIEFEILDFSHDISSVAGEFRGVFRIHKQQDANTEEKLLVYESQVERYDVSGAVEAADRVLEQFLNGISQ